MVNGKISQLVRVSDKLSESEADKILRARESSGCKTVVEAVRPSPDEQVHFNDNFFLAHCAHMLPVRYLTCLPFFMKGAFNLPVETPKTSRDVE